MPRRKKQPATPPDLPPIPSGAIKKEYYNYPDKVWFVNDCKRHLQDFQVFLMILAQWCKGTIAESNSSTVKNTVGVTMKGI